MLLAYTLNDTDVKWLFVNAMLPDNKCRLLCDENICLIAMLLILLSSVGRDVCFLFYSI